MIIFKIISIALGFLGHVLTILIGIQLKNISDVISLFRPDFDETKLTHNQRSTLQLFVTMGILMIALGSFRIIWKLIGLFF